MSNNKWPIITRSPIEPLNPENGDMWVDSERGITLFFDRGHWITTDKPTNDVIDAYTAFKFAVGKLRE